MVCMIVATYYRYFANVIICYYPSGTGYCFRSISSFLSLLARLQENGWTDLHEIFKEGVE